MRMQEPTPQPLHSLIESQQERAPQSEAEQFIFSFPPNEAGYIQMLETVATSTDPSMVDVIVLFMGKNAETYCSYFGQPSYGLESKYLPLSLLKRIAPPPTEDDRKIAQTLGENYLYRGAEHPFSTYIRSNKEHAISVFESFLQQQSADIDASDAAYQYPHRRYREREHRAIDSAIDIKNPEEIKNYRAYVREAGYSHLLNTRKLELLDSDVYVAPGWNSLFNEAQHILGLYRNDYTNFKYGPPLFTPTNEEYDRIAQATIDFRKRTYNAFFHTYGVYQGNPQRCMRLLAQSIRAEKNTIYQRELRDFFSLIDFNKVPIVDGVATIDGESIHIDGDLPETEKMSLEHLSYYGDVGVTDAHEHIASVGNAAELGIRGEHLVLPVRQLQEHDLLLDIDATDIDPEKRAEVFRSFQEGESQKTIDAIAEQHGINRKDFSLREQAYLHLFFLADDTEQQKKLYHIATALGTEGVRSALQQYVHTGSVDGVYALAQETGEYTMEFLMDYSAEALNRAHKRGVAWYEALRREHPHIDISADDCVRLHELHVTRSLDACLAHVRTIEKPREQWMDVLDYFVEELETAQQEFQLALNAVYEMLVVTRTPKTQMIDFRAVAKRTDVLGPLMDTPVGRSLALKIFDEAKKLKSVPALFWETDRLMEQYTERFGFNVEQFLEDIVDEERKRTIVEFGPGSGQAKKQRSKNPQLRDRYVDVAIGDHLYFSVEKLFQQAIDFSQLEKALGTELQAADRAAISRLLYKVLVLDPTNTTATSPQYDKNAYTLLEESLNSPQQLSHYMKDKLQKSTVVCGDPVTMRGQGEIEYSAPIELYTNSTVGQAMEMLKNQFQDYFLPTYTGDALYPYIESYPFGTGTADFSQIAERIKEKTIYAGLGVRSTVYLEGNQYTRFLDCIASGLESDGVYFDDSIREIFGRRYRLPELLAFQQMRPDVTVKIITGPSQPGEDYRSDQVPLALVITKDVRHEERIQERLHEGYFMHNLSELIGNAEYLRSLDADGKMEEEVSEVIGRE